MAVSVLQVLDVDHRYVWLCAAGIRCRSQVCMAVSVLQVLDVDHRYVWLSLCCRYWM